MTYTIERNGSKVRPIILDDECAPVAKGHWTANTSAAHHEGRTMAAFYQARA